jgi:RNA polymerase sigma-70 factor (ECF subfamily)
MTAREWALLVREYSPLVWQAVYRLTAHHADAADCMQETFLAAWKVARRQEVRNWPALLQHLATARALDHLRRRVRQAKHVEAGDAGEMLSGEMGPLAQAQSAEMAAQLRVALADLPRRQGEAYCLRHLNGMSYEEIAAELNMTVSAVGVALHRATERLRVALMPAVMDAREPRRSS